MKNVYGSISDTHHHGWTAFATVNADGINSRLAMTLAETKRCAEEIKARGGKRLYHTGDLFHVRGSVAPSVLIPTTDTYREIIESGIEIRILAGNHDLEFREANRNGSAVTALEGIGCQIVNETTWFHDDRVVMIPWIQNIEELKAEILQAKKWIETRPSPAPLRSMERVADWTLMIHAPIDGVIKGLPSHGLTDVWLAALGFKKVFSGHYHNHKDFGNGVISVGALTHNSWSDVGSKAGFLIIEDDEVYWRKSHAPEFIEIDGSMDEVDIKLAVPNNYVRCTLNTSKQSEIEQVRQFLLDNGAQGVTILAQKKVVEVEREESSSVSAGASIEQSVDEYVSKSGVSDTKALSQLCQSILTDARMEIAE